MDEKLFRFGMRGSAVAPSAVGVEQEEEPAAARRAVFRNVCEGGADEFRGELDGVGKGRRRQHELRFGAVIPADPAEAPDEVSDIRAGYTPVAVSFIHHYEFEPPEELPPFVMPRQDMMELVEVADDDPRFVADGGPAPRRGVPSYTRGRDPAPVARSISARNFSWSLAKAFVG